MKDVKINAKGNFPSLELLNDFITQVFIAGEGEHPTTEFTVSCHPEQANYVRGILPVSDTAATLEVNPARRVKAWIEDMRIPKDEIRIDAPTVKGLLFNLWPKLYREDDGE